MDRLTPNQPVDGIPSGTWNQFYDTKKTVDQLVSTTQQRESRGVSALRTQIHNTTGSDITADFPVLAIGTPVVTPTDRAAAIYESVQFIGTTPDNDTTSFAIVQGPIANGAFQSGVIQGLTWCKVNVTDITHTKASPTNSSSHLKSDTTGVPIYWPATFDDTGEQLALIMMGTAASSAESDFRLIRGMSYGIQSGGTILIDNIRPLANSKDPSEGDNTVQIEVYNLFGQTYADNELVDAAYQPIVADGNPVWETLKTNTGTDKDTLIQGRVTASVTAADPSFLIDTVIPLAHGNDPSGGNPSLTFSVENANGDTFEEDQQIVAVWYDTGITSGWSTLLVERYRAIQGIVYTVSSPLHVKGIQPMEGGRDPRTDPTNFDEIVDVIDYLDQRWREGDIIYAMWNAATLVWEAMAKPYGGGSPTAGYKYTTVGTIGAGSTGTGNITGYFTDLTTEDLGTHTLVNTCSYAINGSGGCTRITVERPPDMLVHPMEFGEGDDDAYLVMGGGVSCGSIDVATDITCSDGEIVPTTETINYLACPEDE